MPPRHLHAFIAFALPSLLGAATGRLLLQRMNDDGPSLAQARFRDASPPTSAARAARSGRLVVVVLDGVGERYFDRAERDGTLRPVTWSQRIDTGTPSLSRPSYHVMFTGIPQEAAAIRNNLHRGRARADTVMSRVRDAGGSVAWALETVDWMYSLAGEPGDTRKGFADARDVDTLAALARDHTLTVVHWVTPDERAHAEGRESAAYERAVTTCFERATRLHDRLVETLGPRGFTLLIGADHGHVARGGHGGPERDVVETRWVRLGGETTRTGAPARLPEGAIAATLTDLLAIEAPRDTAACPARVPNVNSRVDCARVEARRRRLDAEVRAIRAGSVARAQRRVALAALLLLSATAALRRASLRRRVASALSAAAGVSLGAALSFYLLGPGTTLSAIRSEVAFVLHGGATLFLGAALAWPAMRAITQARSRDVALATALVPLAAIAYTTDREGHAMLDVHGQLVAPTTGLMPAAACVALALWSRALRRIKSPQEPGGAAPVSGTTVTP